MATKRNVVVIVIGVIFISLLVAGVGVIGVAAMLFGGGQKSTYASCSDVAPTVSNETFAITPNEQLEFTGEQTEIAGKIVTVGRQRGFKDWEIIGMIQTALQEAKLKNPSSGDGTSAGPFQHIKEWGPKSLRMNVDWAIANRYDELAKIKNRDRMEPFEVFLKMQGASRKAYLLDTNNWPMWEDEAKALFAAAQPTSGDQYQVTNIASVASSQCITGYDALDVVVTAVRGQVGKVFDKKVGESQPAVDGSTLVVWAYAQAGVQIETDPEDQLEKGVSVDYRQDLTQGDVLYYGSSPSSIDRVAMYIDDDTMIEMDTDGKVREKELSWKRYIGASQPIPMPFLATPVGDGLNFDSGLFPIVGEGGWTNPIAGKHGYGSPYGQPRNRPPGYHDGADLNGVPKGYPVRAAAAGKIIKMAPLFVSYGHHIVIEHGDGSITTTYAHQSRFADGLKVGQMVAAGQIIGYVGSTGYSTGNHLHFKVEVDGTPVNPFNFMKTRGVSL